MSCLLGYNRLMNHVRYMVARAIHGEKLKMNLNEYMSVKFPGPYMAAERICRPDGKKPEASGSGYRDRISRRCILRECLIPM